MSVKSNTMIQDVATRSIFPNARQLISSAISFTQGGFLFLDQATHLIKPLAADADAATFLGVAPVTIESGRYPKAYITDVDASVGIPAIPGPQYGSTFKCLLKAGDVITPGQEVWANVATGINGVTVTEVEDVASVGIYQGKGLTAAVGGTEIEVLIKQNLVAGV